MLTHSDIIDLWPDPAPVTLAEDLNIKPNHLRTMKYRDGIPSKYWLGMVRSARKHKIRGVSLLLLANAVSLPQWRFKIDEHGKAIEDHG